MNDIVTREENGPVAGFQRQQMPASAGTNVGAVAIESERAIAEAQGQLILAKRFPRDLNAAYAELMESCKILAFAKTAFYSVPRGRDDDGNVKKVSGPSIRLAEEIARVVGNFEFGHRELSRVDGKSEVEVYAWDKEKNNQSKRQITVMHVIDTRNGPRKLRDQKDVDDKIANIASKQMRGRILALIPKWLQESATEECKKTIAGTNDEPISVRVRKMTQAFAPYGVNVEHLEKYLGHPLDDTTLDELVELLGVFNALKEGEKASDYFNSGEAANDNEKPTLPQIGKPADGSAQQAPHPAAAAAKRTRAAPPAQGEPKADQKPSQAATAQGQPKPDAPESSQQTQEGPKDSEEFF